MTKEEFVEFIESFNKRPGEFTQDEIYEIGKKHKTVEPASHRSWDYVKERTGWQSSKDALRMFVNDRLTKEIRSDEFDGVPSEDINPFEMELNKLYIEKTKVRDLRNSVARGLRDEARVQALKETITETVAQLNALPQVSSENINKADTEIEAILMLSDLHIGVLCSNFYNDYNVEIAGKRLSKLAYDVVAYCKLHKVHKLNVVNLGDLIHGLIHTNARIEAQTDAVTQVMIAGELVSQFLNSVSQAADVVTYRSCSDNHSRTFGDKSEALENENFGRLIDWFLQERLKDSAIEFCNDNIDYSLGKFTLLNGKKVMFAHGHNDSINRSFEAFIGASKEFIDIGLLGHYHSNKTKSFNGFKVFVNGSIVGTEQYALSKRLFSEPEQKLLIFDDNNIVDININLNIK